MMKKLFWFNNYCFLQCWWPTIGPYRTVPNQSEDHKWRWFNMDFSDNMESIVFMWYNMVSCWSAGNVSYTIHAIYYSIWLFDRTPWSRRKNMWTSLITFFPEALRWSSKLHSKEIIVSSPVLFTSSARSNNTAIYTRISAQQTFRLKIGPKLARIEP